MFNFWKWFQHCLALHPVKTQMLSSGLIWGAGDIAAQSINNYTAQKPLVFQDDEIREKINWKRVATTSLFGFGFVGPVGHFWYEGLDRFMRSQLFRPNSLRFVGVKVAIDGFLFGPLDLLLFFTYMGIVAGKSVSQIREDMKRDFLPAFMMEGGVWPIVQLLPLVVGATTQCSMEGMAEFSTTFPRRKRVIQEEEQQWKAMLETKNVQPKLQISTSRRDCKC